MIPQSDAPGTPLGRLKAIADYTIAQGLCSGLEARGAEDFLIESHMRLRGRLEQAERVIELARGGILVLDHGHDADNCPACELELALSQYDKERESE